MDERPDGSGVVGGGDHDGIDTWGDGVLAAAVVKRCHRWASGLYSVTVTASKANEYCSFEVWVVGRRWDLEQRCADTGWSVEGVQRLTCELAEHVAERCYGVQAASPDAFLAMLYGREYMELFRLGAPGVDAGTLLSGLVVRVWMTVPGHPKWHFRLKCVKVGNACSVRYLAVADGGGDGEVDGHVLSSEEDSDSGGETAAQFAAVVVTDRCVM